MCSVRDEERDGAVLHHAVPVHPVGECEELRQVGVPPGGQALQAQRLAAAGPGRS